MNAFSFQKQSPEVFCNKKLFLEILQNSVRSESPFLFFNKVGHKKDSDTGIFQWILRKF